MRRPTTACLALALAACAGHGSYVWIDDYAPAAQTDAEPYRIAVGDVISVRVYNQDGLSAPHEKVRPDGMVSLQLVQDVRAAGSTPDALAELIRVKLKEFMNQPVVTVSVVESRLLSVPVLGEVGKPGQYTLERGAGLLEALAAAGGLTEYAHRDAIFVLRREPAAARIRVRFESLARGEARASAFRLKPGDSIVVE